MLDEPTTGLDPLISNQQYINKNSLKKKLQQLQLQI